MDFTKESIKDLPNHSYDKSLPTFWILEGLVMYMTKPDVTRLLKELSYLTVKRSYIALHFINNLVEDGSSNFDYMD